VKGEKRLWGGRKVLVWQESDSLKRLEKDECGKVTEKKRSNKKE